MGPGLAYAEGPQLAVGYYFSPMTSGLSEGGAHEPGIAAAPIPGRGTEEGLGGPPGQGPRLLCSLANLRPQPTGRSGSGFE